MYAFPLWQIKMVIEHADSGNDRNIGPLPMIQGFGNVRIDGRKSELHIINYRPLVHRFR